MDEVVKLLRTLQGIEMVKEKIKTLVLNLNDLIDNDLSNLAGKNQKYLTNRLKKFKN